MRFKKPFHLLSVSRFPLAHFSLLTGRFSYICVLPQKCVCCKKERGKVAVCIATFPRSGVRFLADYFTATFTAVLPTRTT